MIRNLLILLLLAAGCTMPEEKVLDATSPDTASISTSDSNNAVREPDPIPLPPPVEPIKQPKGIYHSLLPLSGGIEHTVAFYPDFTYQLQETYRSSAKKDSVVIVKGNWSPSDGYIWLYKDQVVRARYNWKGEELQYYSPALKKGFVLQPMVDVLSNNVWREKPKQGILFFGIGNEPFWSVELNDRDSITFQLADWEHPVKMKLTNTATAKDSSVFLAQGDSAQLKLSVYPQFCSDGMSDHIYKNKVRVYYNQLVYNGCGVLYR